jgi:hypothetical protein
MGIKTISGVIWGSLNMLLMAAKGARYLILF